MSLPGRGEALLGDRVPAVDDDDLPGEVGGGRAGEEGDDRSHLLRGPGASHRRMPSLRGLVGELRTGTTGNL